MLISEFCGELATLRLPNCFNPYSDQCPVWDADNAAEHRLRTLESLLRAAEHTDVDALWVGQDLGYNGGRRTGLAFTDDIHVQIHCQRWGVSGDRTTKGRPISERSASVIWRALAPLPQKIFLWNVFPLHPHRPNEAFSNRTHSRKERIVGQEFLQAIIALIKPTKIVAIGTHAYQTVARIDSRSVHRFRHPSYGGQNTFLSQVAELYSCY